MNRDSCDAVNGQSGVSRRQALSLAAVGLGIGGASALNPLDASAAPSVPSTLPWTTAYPTGSGGRSLHQAASAARGETIHALAGVHHLGGEGLRLSSGVRVVGDGPGTIIDVAAGGGRSAPITLAGSWSALCSLSVRGVSAGSSRALVEIGAANCQLVECDFETAGGWAVAGMTSASGLIVRGCRMLGTAGAAQGGGIIIRGAGSCSLSANAFRGVPGPGVELLGASHCSVLGNTVDDSAGPGVFVHGGARDNAVLGNVVSGCGEGLVVESRPGEPDSLDTVLSGNVCTASRADGIRVSGSDRASVTDNNVRGSAAYGILLSKAGVCSVTGNVVYHSGRAGIALVDAQDCVCSENLCEGNGADAGTPAASAGILLMSAARSVISGNRSLDDVNLSSQRYGISMDAGSEANVLAANIVSGNASEGVRTDVGGRTSNDTVPWHTLEATVGRGVTEIPHGLSYPPLLAGLTMLSRGQVWVSRAPDETNLYLQADGPQRRVLLLLG